MSQSVAAAARERRETLAKTRRAASLKGWRTRKRMAAAREREQDNMLQRYLRADRLLWPSSYRPSDE